MIYSPIQSPILSAVAKAITALGVVASAPSPITPVLTAPLTTGVAPFGCMFDGVQTTHTDGSIKPFHDLLYFMDFGDGSAGTYTNGAQAGQSANRDMGGPIFAHVYTVPGTYTAKMWVHDGTSLAGPVTQTVTVQDPDVVWAGTATVCVSASGNFTNAPAGCIQVTNSDARSVFSTYFVSNKRILFRAGEAFTFSATTSTLSPILNFYIGSFGAGAKPTFTATAANQIFLGASANNVYANSPNNIRCVGLKVLSGGFTAVEAFTFSAAPLTTADVDVKTIDKGNITVYDCEGDGIGSLATIKAKLSVLSKNRVVNVTNSVAASGYVPFYSASCNYYACFDNYVDNAHGGEHCIRQQGGDYRYIAHNYTARPAITKQYITVRGWGVASTANGVEAKYTVVRANVMDGTNVVSGQETSQYGQVAPQNTSRNEPSTDLVWEGNHTIKCGASQPLGVGGARITIRNNVTSQSGGATIYIAGKNATMTLDTQDIWIYGNSGYATTTTSYSFVQLAPSTFRITAKNNIGYAPNATKTAANNGTAPTFLFDSSLDPANVFSNNSTNAQIKSVNPLWTGMLGAQTTLADWALGAGSPYIGAGVAIRPDIDARGNLRTAAVDMGAVNSAAKSTSAWTLVP